MNSYYNVVEVESAISNLATQYPGLCTLLTLPNVTTEGRIGNALVISSAPGTGRDGVLLTGGVRGREWGTCEILVAFAVDLISAYSANAGLQHGNRSVPAPAIQAILDSRDLVVFPLVNPDGRAYSQAHYALAIAGWRKNRSRASSRVETSKLGVDIDRNFDVVWDFRKAFLPGNTAASEIPITNTFHGTAPFSEAESRNVKWLPDAMPPVRWLVDVHSCSKAILYNWGIDDTQSDDATRNYRNPTWNGKRGVSQDAYGEYKPTEDAELERRLATRMSDAIFEVHGQRYQAAPSFGGHYPVSGTLDDYAYARQWETPPKPKIHAFIIEHGETFHPAWTVMEGVIDEICAGLLEFCIAVS